MKKVVLVTGGSSGIGKSIGVYLTSKGFTVYGTTRDTLKHPDFKHFTLIDLDVRKPETIQKAINSILEKEGQLDVLVNNAGVGITGPIEETPNKEILNAFAINFNGPIDVMKAVLPQMRKQKSGLIINITSIAGYMGLPYRGVYSASKGALEIVVEAMRMETKSFGVNITTLAPGDFATNIASGRYHVPVLENSPYKAVYEKSLKTMDAHVDEAGNPIMVAKQVYRIINTKKPKVHYRVGTFMQKFSIVLKNVLPDKVYEKLLMNHYKV